MGDDELWFEQLSWVERPLMRLFCFPYAGGTADVYRGLQRYLPKQIEICLVHLPGRGKRMEEPAFTRMDSLVNAVADHMDEKTCMRYALYGHSMGALISFELSRELLRRNGTGPEHLFVSGRRAPQWQNDEPLSFDLPYAEFIAELKRLNGTPPEVLENPELMELFIDLLRADFEVVETYQYHTADPLPCPITVYGGLQDEHVSAASCRAWQEQTVAACKVRMFQGDHFFIRSPGSEFVNMFRYDVLRMAAAAHH